MVEPHPSVADPGSPHGVLGVTVRRPVGVFMVLLAVGLFGWTSFGRLPLNLLPDLSFPTLTVRTEWEGAAPEEVEERVTRPLEEGLRVVPGLVEVTSVSRAGLSSIRLRFAWGTDMRFAGQDVAERLQQTRNGLPDDVDAPLVLRYDPTLEPVLRLAVVGTVDETRLRHYAEEDIGRALEKLQGVAAAKVRGGLEQEVHVDLREDLLAASGVSVAGVIGRLAESNVDVAAGMLLDGDTEYLVRTANRLMRLEEIEDVVVSRRGNAVTRLSDVGQVRMAARERDVVIRVDGRPAVLVEIHREAGANLVSVASRVLEAVFGTSRQQAYVAEHGERLQLGDRSRRPVVSDDVGGEGSGNDDEETKKQRVLDRQMTSFLAWKSPEGIELVSLEDRSAFVRDALDEVRYAVLLGGLLAVGVLFLFLRQLRPTAIIAISIPASVLFTFAAMFLADVSLNLMSLGGLALGIGMLVDNSIVVLESIVRCREEGDSVVRATLRGTRAVGSAVVASTLTTVAVFLPVIFVEGVAGQIFRDQALTVVLSLLASLAAALFLIPMLASLRRPQGEQGELPAPWKFEATRSRWRRLREGSWGSRGLAAAVLPLSLSLELVGTLVWGLLLVLMRVLVGSVKHGERARGLLTPITWPFDRAWLALERSYPPLLRTALGRPGVTLAVVAVLVVYTLLLYPWLGGELIPRVRQGLFSVEVSLPVTTPVLDTDHVLAGAARNLASLPGVRRVASVAGVDRGDLEAAEQGANTGRLWVYLEPGSSDRSGEARVLEQVRSKLSRRPELGQPRVGFPELVSMSSTLEVEIADDDPARLRRSAMLAASVLERLTALADVRSGLEHGTPEVLLALDPELLARHDLGRRAVAETVRTKLQGDRANRLGDDRRLEIRVALDVSDLQGVEALRRLRVDQGGEGTEAVYLADVAAIKVSEGPSEVRRARGRRVHRLSSNLAPGVDLETASLAVESSLYRELGPTVDFHVVGQSEELERSRQSLLLALLSAAFLVYVVMASQFESLLQPMLIVLTLPLALVGVLSVLFVASQPLGVVVFIGLIVLAGIVVNNAIVLVDTTNRLRAEGVAIADAVERASILRLRPILMTTATTVLGVVPMLLAGGAGTEIRRPLALTVATGLISATLLTLVVIPVTYKVVEEWLERRRGELT